jgi:hypothetical protein
MINLNEVGAARIAAKEAALAGEPSAIAACRKIVAECSYAQVDGVTVDLFSANTIVQVYDALNPGNRAKMGALPIEKMARLAFKLVG